jgi:glucokinase
VRAVTLGIDVGGTRIKWSLVNTDGEPLESGDVATPKAGGDELVDCIIDIAKAEGASASAVGLAVPGLVNTRSRETLFIPNIPGDWANYPLGRCIGSALDKPVIVLNDARAFGYAEFQVGAGREFSDALFLTVGTGIGGALARDGAIVIDEIDNVPEMGHVAVEMHGEACGCGASGCLETVASASAVVAHSIRAVLTGQSPTLVKLCEGRIENLTAETVAHAADLGDACAVNVFERAGGFIGMAAAGGCLMSRSEALVIGGGLAGAFRHFAPAVRRLLTDRVSVLGHVEVVQAQLGSRAGSIGAALYARDQSTKSRKQK